MDMFDFEELMAEILGVTDEQREDDDFLLDEFYKIGVGAGCGEYVFKTVERGGITCKACIDRIKYFKSIRL